MSPAQLQSEVAEPPARIAPPRVRDQLMAALQRELAAEAGDGRRDAAAGMATTVGEEARTLFG
jgi:hypothetical protein